ncbi:MAG: hypothetical protein H6642_14155 [Caldilineaceae bacterium]|nr:hypothetical protein [Caldilineaceae bacterium]MCB9139480.1 hypothetical protein [Caldilineaceae bacterium]
MQPEMPSPARVDALLAYLDGFQQRDTPFARWQGGRQEDGIYFRPAPVYAPDVIAFFHELNQPCWVDPDCNPRRAGGWLDHPRFIETAGYDRIRIMLTYCLRGEEQSAGHWERMLTSGKLIAVLERLRYMRTAFPQTLTKDEAVQPISPASDTAAKSAPAQQQAISRTLPQPA